jgi:hypothetical protein
MRGRGEGRKRFFFEKKNQKTFLILRLGFIGYKRDNFFIFFSCTARRAGRWRRVNKYPHQPASAHSSSVDTGWYNADPVHSDRQDLRKARALPRPRKGPIAHKTPCSLSRGAFLSESIRVGGFTLKRPMILKLLLVCPMGTLRLNAASARAKCGWAPIIVSSSTLSGAKRGCSALLNSGSRRTVSDVHCIRSVAFCDCPATKNRGA